MTLPTLQTSLAHRILAGPLGWVMTTGWFDSLKMSMLPREFRMARARALAFVHPETESFFQAVGVTAAARKKLAGPAEKALAELGCRRAALAPVKARFEEALWRGGERNPADLVVLEQQHRRVSEAAIKPGMLFRFLSNEPSFAPTGFSVPDPQAALAAAQPWLDDPATLYAAPPMPERVERSTAIPGPSGPEYLIRFSSPSAFTGGDTVTARVYEPSGGAEATPTFIYGSGLGMVYDLISYWPEEDYLARRLAARGVRVVLPESPWHGRRELAGRYSGEPYLARAPVPIFELFSAQAQETAQIIAWARDRGAPRVGVGGVSLGALITQQIVGHAAHWPGIMRPDMAFIGAGSGRVDEVVVKGDLSGRLGMGAAVRAAGWTDPMLARLRPLLDPPDAPGIPADRVLAYLGRRDETTPFVLATSLLDGWGVPPGNRIIHDAGHIALYTRLIRGDTAVARIAAMLSPDFQEATSVSLR
ncbi:MAG TPA: hypothetical protein RMF84_06255 [Polyangiaceae bacterium LLY-WYZ-14_1]|nr:hypothetical protein [Polyangiaceae bacterium LLY-WYZ-14_1]